ncbi:hypothetical protein PHYC_01980 [Phycisphaerales bacterium]|nr:hypothetical protein PHYC_01980 [Phycisphaerales bacterium]
MRIRPLATSAAFALAHACSGQDVDLSVSEIPSIALMGHESGIMAYSVGVSVCNQGPADAAWQGMTNQHPLWGCGLYRLANGRLEQVGVSWLRHASLALAGSGCGPCNGQDGSVLGAGCMDSTSAATNGQQTILGPRFEVNAATGAFPYPFSNPGGPTGNAIFKRCQVSIADASDTEALYFMEVHVVHPGESPATRTNNASYRRVTFTPATLFPSLVGQASQRTPAVHAWRDHGLGPDQPDQAVQISPIDVPDDGRFLIASRAFDAGGSWWRYEFAVENLNSDRAGASFRVPIPAGAAIRSPGFHDVAYHSGEPFDGTDWTFSLDSNATWTAAHTFDQLPTANALRWGTTYSFRFECNAPPRNSTSSLTLFKPGSPSVISAPIVGPGCDPDVNCDGSVNGFDIQATEEAVNGDFANFCQSSADLNSDGSENGFDIETEEQRVNGAPC